MYTLCKSYIPYIKRNILILSKDKNLISIIFHKIPKNNVKKIVINDKNIIMKKNPVSVQLKQYFSGKRKSFDVKMLLRGTEFQKKVWKEISKIPYGKTITYSDISLKIGKPNAFRAVANACGKNPIPIIIPCHRVLQKGGGLGGYSGGIDIKKNLLKLEKINID